MGTVKVFRKYIEIFNEKSFRVNATLEGTPVSLTFHYNFRSKRYHLTLQLLDGTNLITGLAINPNTVFPVASDMKIAGLNGRFTLIPIDNGIVTTDETLENWADYYFLVYRVEIELDT